MAAKMKKGLFDMDDLSQQLGQMSKMGGMGSIMKMMPGIGKMAKQVEAAGIDDTVFKKPAGDHLLNDAQGAQDAETTQCQPQDDASAKGSGSSVQEDQPASENAPPDGRHDESHVRQEG